MRWGCVQSVACCREIPVLANTPCCAGITARKKAAALSSSMEDAEETATGLQEKHYRYDYFVTLSNYYFVF